MRTRGPRSPTSAIATGSAGRRPTSCGIEPVAASAWPTAEMARDATSPWALAPACGGSRVPGDRPSRRMGSAVRGPVEADPAPLPPGVQRRLADARLPGQIDGEPFIQSESGPIGPGRGLIAGRPPPQEPTHDVLAEAPRAPGRPESLRVEPLGDGGEGTPLRAELADPRHQPGEVARLLVPPHRPDDRVRGALAARPSTPRSLFLPTTA
jgi:hypothetical protein